MAHLIDRVIALWARMEPHILQSPGWMAFWLGLFVLLGWRLLRSYVRLIAREVQPKAAKAPPQPEWRAAVSELHNRMDELAHARLVGDGSPFPDAATLRPGMVLIWNGRAWVGHPTIVADQPQQAITRKSRGKGKKATVEIDRPPTAWERITEDDDAGPDQT